MRKGHSLLVLLIVVFGVILIPSIQVIVWGPVDSTSVDFHGLARVGLGGDAVAMSGSRAGTPMLQFKAGGHLLGFQPKRVYFASLDHALSVEFLGTPGVMPKAATGGKETGQGSSVPSLGMVVYEELWEGISLTYEAREGGIAESTYQIKPWGEVSKIRLGYNVPVEVQGDGSLRFKFERGYLTESRPMAWQEIGRERVPVEVTFRVKGGEVGFSVGKYDPSYPLIIDPTYSWHTFYGSSTDESALGFAVDASGNVYITGGSGAWNGPTDQSPLHTYSGGLRDIFVLKLNSSGAYQWHTFYGSTSAGYGIATDTSGNIYITGSSDGTWNGPAGQSPLHARSGSVRDIFVLKLNSSGAYQWHTFYGSNADGGRGIAIDSSGGVYVAGGSNATWNGPAGQTPLHAHNGLNEDIVVLKLNGSGAYQWHTFYGSSVNDLTSGFAMDSSGNVYVTGHSGALWNGPTGQSPLNAYSGGDDIFVLKLNSSGAYQWHTFYGSSSTDYGEGIAIDASGNVYITGYSYTTWTGPYKQSPLHAFSGGLNDIFVLKLSSSGFYQWHTFYGSSSRDSGSGIATDGNGNVYITGQTEASWNGPAGQNPLHAHSGSFDIFVLKLNSSGAYQWHTFYGSSVTDYGGDIATNGSGNIYITGGSTANWNGPTGQSPLHVHSGGFNFDFFVLKLSGVPNRIDFSGDGMTDLFWRRATTGQTAIWIMDGSTYSIGSPGTVSNLNWQIKGMGDFDGNGKTDIFWQDISTGWIMIWFMDGATITSQQAIAQVGLTWQIKKIGDFDGDGKADILWKDSATGWTAIWFMDGTTVKSVGAPAQVGDASWQIKEVGDFNGDGRADILWQNTTSGWTYIWFMNGATITSGAAPAQVGDSSWQIRCVGDFDGDGKWDVFWQHTTTGWTYLWFMEYDGTIASDGVPGVVTDTNWQIMN